MKEKGSPNEPRGSSFRWIIDLPVPVKIAILVVILVGITRVALPQSLFDSFNCQVRKHPPVYRSSNGYFIDKEIVVVARRDQISEVIVTPGPSPTPTPPTATTLFVAGTPTGTPATPGVTATPAAAEKVILNLIEDCDLSYLNSRKATDNSKVEENAFVMRLYEIPNGSTVVDVLSQIEAKAEGKEIFADPNYITRLSDSTSDLCGAGPSDGGGNGGKPFGEPGAPDVTPYDPLTMKNTFITQWAFVGSQGINLSATPTPASPTLTGRGVRVGVFDTSPYRTSFPFVKRVGEAFPSPLWFPNWDAGGTAMASNHGLFVASLIHRMAPESRIQLIRVLYEDGCGELWTLNKGLEAYKSRMSAWTGKLNKTVINMSLGIRLPDEDSDPQLSPLIEEELNTLDRLVDGAYEMGAIIVAAAGNDSTKVSDYKNVVTTELMEMQVPASNSHVLGVAAINEAGDPSCFTNIGDIAAPGGDGGRELPTPGPTPTPGPSPTPDPSQQTDLCAPRAFSWNKQPDPCPDMATCEYGLISLVETRYGPRYMLWSGTSFATPLVSGMAALAYETWERDFALCVLGKGQSPLDRTPTPAEPLGTGPIDLGDLTDPFILNECSKTP